MAAFDEIQKPIKTNLLICFCDLFRFVDVAKKLVNTHRRIIKFIGDSVLSKFVITPQAFRKLKPETRKMFHKFTPPVGYIAE